MPKMSRPVQQPAKPMGQNARRSINRLGGAAFGSFVAMSSAALGTGDFYEGPTRPRTERRCSGRAGGLATSHEGNSPGGPASLGSRLYYCLPRLSRGRLNRVAASDIAVRLHDSAPPPAPTPGATGH